MAKESQQEFMNRFVNTNLLLKSPTLMLWTHVLEASDRVTDRINLSSRYVAYAQRVYVKLVAPEYENMAGSHPGRYLHLAARQPVDVEVNGDE
jgi:hypothetical protein